MVELKIDTTDRILGKKHHTCRICGAEGNFDTYLAREMMQGTRDEFPYFVCGSCKCLQIARVPENLGDYYGSGYYSYQVPENPDMEFDVPFTHTEKVLDVGCGAGAWLVGKAMEGWGNLYGCDPFLEKSRNYGSRVSIRNCSIHEMEGEGTFDIIRMSDSFEHMTDPLEVLKSAKRLLKLDGTLCMTIPTYPNIAFERFGPHWYQLDAPRHIFLHSKESLKWLSEQSGLAISGIRYNSNNNQIIRSYFYQHGVTYFEQTKELVHQYFGNGAIRRLQAESEEWNEKEYGDHMEVFWKKSTVAAIKNGKKVVFQRFSGNKSRHSYPYPPLYQEPDADYICFTDDAKVKSSCWKIQVVQDLEKADLEPYLEKYAIRWEIKPGQIQMGPLSGGMEEENIITVPALDELPVVTFDIDKLVPTVDEKGNYIYRKNPVYQKGKYNGRPLLLTIGVPVSNQIDTIERCLSSVKPLLDKLDAELVVVDTGSTDGTVEVCKRYGARVYSLSWCNNMSAVRNEAIYHARGEWYMSIDDDEWFEDVEDILQFFLKGTYKKYDMASYIQRNYIDSMGKVYEDHYTARMARITPELHFEGRIHDAMTSLAPTKTYVLHSYAHHYGFVHDKPEKAMEKFIRNASILLYDVYEYPKNLRYLFQLANEFRCVRNKSAAIPLFAQTIAMAKEEDNEYRGRNGVIELLSCMYDTDDPRFFRWAQQLENLYPLQLPQQACVAWCKESLAFLMEKPAEQILLYYEQYRNLLEQYQKDPGASKVLVFGGLAMVEHEFYIMDAKAIAFYAYLQVGKEHNALELLSEIALEVVENKRTAVFAGGFAAGEAVYEALYKKLTAMQWEEWSETILDIYTSTLAKDILYSQQLERLPGVLARISIPSILRWIERSEEIRSGKTGERLYEYAMEHDITDSPIQELYFLAWLLKEAYVKKRTEENGKEILYRYVTVMGAFAEEYYNPDMLIDLACTAIPPDIRAAWRMAVVLADGKATSENVMILKQALGIFPAFHEEIRSILTELK